MTNIGLLKDNLNLNYTQRMGERLDYLMIIFSKKYEDRWVGMVMGRVWSGSGQTRTLLFFMDPDPNSDPKGPKFSDLDPNPTDLTGLGSLMDP